jgi:hypothetical protein
MASRRKAAEPAADLLQPSEPAPPVDIFALPVFPAADIFPMMDQADLGELAADIRQHGQREPLVLATVEREVEQDDGSVELAKVEMLVDGRNRRAACQLAGVEPAVRRLNGEDPTAYVMSANIHRRHMTKGQRAMAVAMMYPKGRQGQRTDIRNADGSTSGKIPEVAEVDPSYIGRARTVLKFTPEVAPQVLSGALMLDSAYTDAKVRKERSELESTKLEEAATRLAKRMAALKERDEGLYDKVVEGDLTIKEAEDEARAREMARERLFENLSLGFTGAMHSLASSFAHDDSTNELLAFLEDQGRRRQLRKLAYKNGHMILQKQAVRGFELAQKVFALLDEHADEDGQEGHDG